MVSIGGVISLHFRMSYEAHRDEQLSVFIFEFEILWLSSSCVLNRKMLLPWTRAILSAVKLLGFVNDFSSMI